MKYIKSIVSITALTTLTMVFFLGLVLLLGCQARAVEIGGNINIDYYLNDIGEDVNTIWQGEAQLEFYIPSGNELTPRFVLQTGVTAGQTYTEVKYLYLRRSLENGRLTVGRQPISWAYGSVINPLDYGFTVEGLAGEDITPGVDGVRYSHSLGAGRRLELALDYPDNVTGFLREDTPGGVEPDSLGAGFRLRLPAPGYDLSLNAVTRKTTALMSEQRLSRGGLTFKTDVGDYGVYGAAAYYHLSPEPYEDVDDIVLQLGVDTSFFVGEFSQQRVLVQGEYLRFLNQELSPGVLAAFSDEMAGEDAYGDEGIGGLLSASDLLILNVNYERDMFSSLGLSLMAETEENNVALLPYYSDDLGGGFEYRVQGNILRDKDDQITLGTGVGLTYYF